MPGTASLAPVSEDGQDHSGPLPAHVPCHSLAGDEERPQKAIYWTQEFVEREVLEQGLLVVHDAHRVEGDVDVAGQRSDGVGVLLDRSFIESVNLGGLDRSASGGDVSRHGVEPGLCAPGDENTRAFPSEHARYGAADSTAAAIDDGVLVVK
jgi:hypothetical protein